MMLQVLLLVSLTYVAALPAYIQCDLTVVDAKGVSGNINDATALLGTDLTDDVVVSITPAGPVCTGAQVDVSVADFLSKGFVQANGGLLSGDPETGGCVAGTNTQIQMDGGWVATKWTAPDAAGTVTITSYTGTGMNNIHRGFLDVVVQSCGGTGETGAPTEAAGSSSGGTGEETGAPTEAAGSSGDSFAFRNVVGVFSVFSVLVGILFN